MSTPEYEKGYWNSYYEEALKGEGQEADQSLWWEIADRDLVERISALFPEHEKKIDVLEAGCGSGSSSFMLCKHLNIRKLTLVDISSNALEFARRKSLAERIESEMEFVNGNIFDLAPFEGNFDLVWNVGLIEHYQPEDIKKIIWQMYRATKIGGYLAIGIPNRNSIAVLKAAALGSWFGKKYLSWIKGYKNETEILYSKREIMNLYKEVQSSFCPTVEYAGSPLWVGAPRSMVRGFDRFFKMKPFSFIVFFVLKRKS